MAAAEAAVSAALRKNAALKQWSVQELHFCYAPPGNSRYKIKKCNTRTSVEEAVTSLVSAWENKRLLVDRCLPYTASTFASSPNANLCQLKCADTDPDTALGEFQYEQPGSPWEVQRHIRLWGGVVTRLNIHDDFKPFFEKSPYGVYKGPNGSPLREPHAVLLVGYDNIQRFWVFKNSWGAKWANGGYGKISFDAVETGILAPDDTYGITFKPRNPLPLPYQLCPHRTRIGCYMVKPPPNTWASQLADDLRMTNLLDLLTDNVGVIKDASQALPSAHLVVCNLQDDVIKQARLEAKCPTPPPKCDSRLPPQGVRSLSLRSKRRVGSFVEIHVAWGLPPGSQCVTQYKVQVLNLRTFASTKQEFTLKNPDAAGFMTFKTKPIPKGQPGPAYLFDVVAVNSAGQSVARTLTVQA